MGFVVPAVLPRHRIGMLVCFRETQRAWIGAWVWCDVSVQRCSRPSGIGIEILPGPRSVLSPSPAGQKACEPRLPTAAAGWSDAIIVSLDGQELVLPAGAYFENLEIDLRSEFGQWKLRLEALLHRGPDYDRIRFSRIS